jgi:hypothetical protein
MQIKHIVEALLCVCSNETCFLNRHQIKYYFVRSFIAFLGQKERVSTFLALILQLHIHAPV